MLGQSGLKHLGKLMENKKPVSSSEVTRLKDKGLISESEFAFIEGDYVIAENAQTRDKRVLGRAGDLLVESGSKRVLRG